MDFNVFKAAVAAQFEKLQQTGSMFRVAVDKDELWTTYQNAFPEGTNPVYRERREHDCTCCKQFIRAVGNCVAFIDGVMVSVWDIVPLAFDDPYQHVTNQLGAFVRSKAIVEPFLHYEKTAGTDKNYEGATLFHHFFVNIKPQFVMKKADIPTELGKRRTAQQVLKRALEEITEDAVTTVIDLIDQGSLYRGEEHKHAVVKFYNFKRDYLLDEMRGDAFTWLYSRSDPAVVNIRNTSIGTLLVDISEGMDLEGAVKKFEAMVAPANYKRTTALITPAMIEKAKETINEMGLGSALARRYATLRDISVNNVLFADRTSKQMMNDVFDTLAAETGKSISSKALGKVEEVPIAKFITDILPKVDSVEVLFENKHAGNLVSLIAPEDATAGKLFKWGTNFSWAYNGDVADSMKEKVKVAGGNVTGDLCCRLAWDNSDDLDLHLETASHEHIYYGDPYDSLGGRLDVDANGRNGIRPNPVENIFYTDRRRLTPGVYHLYVHQYNRRNLADPRGFQAEIDFMGTVYSFNHDKSLRTGDKVTVAKFKYSHDKGVEIIESLASTQASKDVWGMKTQTFHKVNVMMMSPNHWDGENVGNKHYFFMLAGAKNDGSARGFYNEFLDSRLDPHRKVFEMVGSKMRPAETPDQLSGLGFSSTQKNEVTVRVKGSFNRSVKIIF